MEIDSETHGKIPGCVSHLFKFCAPCSDNQMCLEIQNKKLAKVRAKQLTMNLSIHGDNIHSGVIKQIITTWIF